MEKANTTNWSSCTSLILLLLCIGFSCKKSIVQYEDTQVDKIIKIIHSKTAIRDSLKELNRSGIKFVVCRTRSNEHYEFISFTLTGSSEFNKSPYKISGNFKIESIEGVDVLFLDSDNVEIDINKKNKKKVVELLGKGYITFDGPIKTFDGDFITFVFCKNNENNFTSYNFNMIVKAEEKARSEDKPYNINIFYPKCK